MRRCTGSDRADVEDGYHGADDAEGADAADVARWRRK
jgi:hypothetical protein